jgi:hypothetical protein
MKRPRANFEQIANALLAHVAARSDNAAVTRNAVTAVLRTLDLETLVRASSSARSSLRRIAAPVVLMKETDLNFRVDAMEPLLGRFVIRAGTVANDLPSKAGAYLSKRVRLGAAKHNGVLRVEGEDEVVTVAPKCHEPFRTLYAGGQRNPLTQCYCFRLLEEIPATAHRAKQRLAYGPRLQAVTLRVLPIRSSIRPYSYRMKTCQFKNNRNDRSWKHRSWHVCHFANGFEGGHGDQRATGAPGKEIDPRGTGASGGSKRAVSRIDRTSDRLGECHGVGSARASISDRSMRANPQPTTSVSGGAYAVRRAPGSERRLKIKAGKQYYWRALHFL